MPKTVFKSSVLNLRQSNINMSPFWEIENTFLGVCEAVVTKDDNLCLFAGGWYSSLDVTMFTSSGEDTCVV